MKSSINLLYSSSHSGAFAWTLMLVLINFIAFIIAANSNILLGDLEGLIYSNKILLLTSTTCIIFSIFTFFYLFKLTLRIPVLSQKKYNQNNAASLFVGCYILTFIVYVNFTGAFIAASSFRGGDFLSAIFSAISPDAIFLIYFASRKKRSHTDPVFFLWIFSSIQRGWIGLIFTLFALKIFEMIRDRKLSLKIIAFFIILIAIFPFLDILKLYIRVIDHFNIYDLFEHFVKVINSIEINYINSILFGLEKLIGRIQLISHATFIQDNKLYFDLLLSSGQLVPFWKEGIYGIAWDKTFGINHQIEVPQALAALIDPTNGSSWNVNPSIVGWLSIYSDYFPFTLIYLAIIIIIITFLVKSISKDSVFINFIYLIISTLLIPGWIAQLITFGNACLVYLIISKLYKIILNSVDSKFITQNKNNF